VTDASFILATLGGVRQIVGYDAVSLGGWDPETGRRIWRLEPKWEGDFNVPTPMVVDGKLLASTENNGTRLYEFDTRGQIIPEPAACNEDLIPDTSTPIAVDGLVFGSCGELLCLDLENGLKTLWAGDEDDLADYCSLIAGNGRVLVTTQSGELCLLRAGKSGLDKIASVTLFDDVSETERDVWSHPALAGNRFYVRNLLGVYCFLLE
jgi:outer membrane protein assembly factor BamB